MNQLFDKSGAHFSDCGRYRYALWRQWSWDKEANCVAFIGMNPSTADHTVDDQTIRKDIGFAKKWGYGGIVKFNLYGFIATQPKDMFASLDPVGPDNSKWIGHFRPRIGLWLAVWGGSVPMAVRRRLNWNAAVEWMLATINEPVYCIGKTADGSPLHTSRPGYDSPRELFWEPVAKGGGS